MVQPTNLDRLPDPVPQPAHGPDVLRIADIPAPRDRLLPDRKQAIVLLRPSPSPRVVFRDLLLDLRTKHATHADRPHPGDVRQHPERIPDHDQRTGRPPRPFAQAASGDGRTPLTLRRLPEPSLPIGHRTPCDNMIPIVIPVVDTHGCLPSCVVSRRWNGSGLVGADRSSLLLRRRTAMRSLAI